MIRVGVPSACVLFHCSIIFMISNVRYETEYVTFNKRYLQIDRYTRNNNDNNHATKRQFVLF